MRSIENRHRRHNAGKTLRVDECFVVREPLEYTVMIRAFLHEPDYEVSMFGVLREAKLTLCSVYEFDMYDSFESSVRLCGAAEVAMVLEECIQHKAEETAA